MASAAAAHPTTYDHVQRLLGGKSIFPKPMRTPLEVHDALDAGLPAQAVLTLTASLVVLNHDSWIAKALGMSLRTAQRKHEAPTKTLSSEQSSRAWKFAEVLARATEIFGGQEQAEQWLSRPAIGLGRRRPIELLGTQAGVEMVEDHLTQMEYGVYI